MNADDWNRRYATTELVWTAEPNRFLVQESTGLTSRRRAARWWSPQRGVSGDETKTRTARIDPPAPRAPSRLSVPPGHWRHSHVRLGAGLQFGLLGIVGSLAGSALNRRLDGDALLFAAAAMVGVGAGTRIAESDRTRDDAVVLRRAARRCRPLHRWPRRHRCLATNQGEPHGLHSAESRRGRQDAKGSE